MSITTSQTATNTAAAVPVFRFSAVEGPATVIVRNNDAANAVWLGGPSVTAATGMNLPAASTLVLALGSGDDLYALAAAGSPVVMVLARTP